MSSASCKRGWAFRVNAKIHRPIPRSAEAGRLAAMFGLKDGWAETLYEGLEIALRPGQIIAAVGPSGAGKTVLLRQIARRVPGAIWLGPEALRRSRRPPITTLAGGTLGERLEMLSRCGLAEATALITPAKYLSGGQLYRLALAEALYAAARRGRDTLVVADEFGAGLDAATATVLCRHVRKLIAGSRLCLLAATPRAELLGALQPDRVVVKPLRAPARVISPKAGRAAPGGKGEDPRRWPIVRGTLKDYEKLGTFHYLAGPPAAHKRVYVIRPPRGAGAHGHRRACRACLPAGCGQGWAGAGGADTAAVLVVSPPLANVRGRNFATGGRYCGPDRAAAMRLLNDEIECISRVVVHPVYRGCGLAVRLVRRALAMAQTPMTEALAAMGAVHPFFEKAGMTAYRLGPDEATARLISAAEAVGLSQDDLAAVAKVRQLLSARPSATARFFRRELEVCIACAFGPKQLARLSDPVAEVCRRSAMQYVYYLATTK